MKIAYIVHRFPVLSETFVVDEITEMKRSGIDISVFAFERSGDRIVQKKAAELSSGVSYALDPKSDAGSLLRVLMANLFFLFTSPRCYIGSFAKYVLKTGKKEFAQIFYLCSLVKSQKAQHIHSHFACLGATAAMIVSRFLHIPFSFTVHAHDIFAENDFLEDKLERAEYVIAISDYNKAYLLKRYPGIHADKIKVIHCGVDTEIFRPQQKIQGDDIHLLSGGRLVEKKGFSYLIRSCKLLLDRGIRFRCDIFGDGPLKESLSGEIKNLGLERVVHFIGAVGRDEVLRLLADCDIFVLSSVVTDDGDREGIPVVLMEAMASGLAAVSTDISGIPELITSGKDGILVKQKDEIALAEAIQRLIENTALRDELAANGRMKIEELFNSGKNAKSLSEIFTAKQIQTVRLFQRCTREHAACNLCGNDAAEVLYSGVSFDGFRYNHVRCKKCGLIYADPMPSVDCQTLDDMAMRLWYRDFLSAERFDWGHLNIYRDYNRLRMEALERYKKGGNLLEVGCGNGYFLKFAKDKGWNVRGIEVCGGLAAYVDKHLEVNVLAGTLEQAKFSDNYFDVIYLNHILEHLKDPSGFLAEAGRVLRKDGVLFISVPNARDILTIVRKLFARITRGWEGYLNPPMHLYAFSPDSLSKLLKKSGFRALKMYTVAEGHRVYFPDYSGLTLKKICKRILAIPMQFAGMGAHVVAYAIKR